MNFRDILDFPYDPWILLGVPRIAEDREILGAWKKAGSPRDGLLFQAYQMIKDDASRRQTELLGPKPYESPLDAKGSLKRKTRYLGPSAWYEVLNRR